MLCYYSLTVIPIFLLQIMFMNFAAYKQNTHKIKNEILVTSKKEDINYKRHKIPEKLHNNRESKSYYT